jgi:hypothetical protein
MKGGIFALAVSALLASCQHAGKVLTYGAEDMPQKTPTPMDLVPGNTQDAPPPLAPSRRVEEVDCSKPVDLSKGNLRCK